MITAMFKITISLLLLLFLPGYVTLRALKVKGLGWSEVLFLSVFSSTLLTSWLGLLLAEMALFSLWSLLFLLLFYSVSMAVVFRVRPSWGKLPRLRLDIGYWLLVIVVVAGLLFFRPFESVLGTSDSGVYLGMGVNIDGFFIAMLHPCMSCKFVPLAGLNSIASNRLLRPQRSEHRPSKTSAPF